MTRICGWLVDRLSRTLEPDERNAVLGDFAESDVSGGQALRDLLGLVVRRQAALWKDWRPWLAVIGIAGLVCLALIEFSIGLSGAYDLYFWIIRNYRVIDLKILEQTGLTLRHGIVLLVCHSFLLVSWSWTGGFVLGSLSRRTIWVNGALLCLAWLIFCGVIRSMTPPRLCTVLFLLPLAWGARQGLRPGALTLRQTIFLAAGIASMSALAIWIGGWWRGPMGQPRLLSLAVLSWPVWYMVAAASSRRAFLAIAVLIGSAATASAQISPQDYPQWRGRNRDGSASAFFQPKSWPEKLTRKWKVEAGEGYATPIVVGDAVYSFTRRDGAEVMMALNAANGETLWRTGYPAPYKMFAATKVHGEGPKSTPLFHNGKLYTLGISGIVSAFDAASGKLLWQKPAPPEQPFYGAASSPVGDKDLVIVHPGNYGPLTAFDANTGAVKWTAGGDGAYASPLIVELEGTRQVVSVTQKSVVGVSVADGAPLWQHPWAPDMPAISPILYGETLIVSGHNMGVTALKPVKHDGKWVTDVVWENKDVSMFMSNPVLVRDTLFGLSHRASGQFFALDAKTGKVLWLGQPRAATNTAVVKAGDLLFLLNDNAELIVANSSRTGFEPLKRYTVSASATWAQPAISGNRVFVKDASSLALWTLN